VELRRTRGGYISRQELRVLGITYSRKELWRLSKLGRFPKPEQFSHSRVGYKRDEVFAWLENKAGRVTTETSLTQEV
jgi:predicted DNA-binding transcriptional regulator AlpA